MRFNQLFAISMLLIQTAGTNAALANDNKMHCQIWENTSVAKTMLGVPYWSRKMRVKRVDGQINYDGSRKEMNRLVSLCERSVTEAAKSDCARAVAFATCGALEHSAVLVTGHQSDAMPEDPCYARTEKLRIEDEDLDNPIHSERTSYWDQLGYSPVGDVELRCSSSAMHQTQEVLDYYGIKSLKECGTCVSRP